MVDIGIGPLEAPKVRIGREGLPHVGIDQSLKILAQSITIGTNNNIGATAFGPRDVAPGKGQGRIAAVPAGGDPDLAARRGKQAARFAGRRRERHLLGCAPAAGESEGRAGAEQKGAAVGHGHDRAILSPVPARHGPPI